jgi:hypothetical protein
MALTSSLWELLPRGESPAAGSEIDSRRDGSRPSPLIARKTGYR